MTREIQINNEITSPNGRYYPMDHLLGVSNPISHRVYSQIVQSERNILDFGDLAPEPQRSALLSTWQEQLNLTPPERLNIVNERIKPSILNTPTFNHSLTLSRINPETEWEASADNKPDLFFGMGGGSTSIIRAASMEALIMFMTAEKMRREWGLGKARAILANRITYTNLPYSPDFLPPNIDISEVQTTLNEHGPSGIEERKDFQTKIDARLGAERDIYTAIAQRMGFDMGKWDIFLQTDIDKVVDPEALARYKTTMKVHDEILSSISGSDEYHYAQEDGIIDSLVNGPQGGVKLGWWIRDLDRVNGGYIMDEQPFHARWILGQSLREDTEGNNRVTLAYALAAPRLYPDAYGNMRKASPYICYDPEDMITLHPDEDVVKKFEQATKAGGGFNFGYIAEYYHNLTSLFEDLTGHQLITVDIDGESVEIDSAETRFKGQKIALKVKAMKDWLMGEGVGDKIRETWKVFDENSPQSSDGLPMSLPTSQYFEEAGIQPTNLYYRIKSMTYDEASMGELYNLYQGSKERINLTRDILILSDLIHKKVWRAVEHITKNSYFSPITMLTEEVSGVYKAVEVIGKNTKIGVLDPNNSLYQSISFQPEEAIKSSENHTTLPINPLVANDIASKDTQEVSVLATNLENFLTVISYPNTQSAREKAIQLGYDIGGLDDRELKTLQDIAEGFFESRLKGSTPRNKWSEIYI